MVFAERKHVRPRDPVEAILAARRSDLPVADPKEIGGVAARDKSMRIEHQRLIGPRIDRLEQRRDQVEAAVGIQAHVEHVSRGAANARGMQTQTACQHGWIGRLVIRHDDHRGMPNRVARILVRGGFHAPGHHQPQMDAVAHFVRVEQAAHFSDQAAAIEADVEADLSRAPVESIEVLIEEEQCPLVQA